MRDEPVTVPQLKRLLHHASQRDQESVTLGYEVVTMSLRRGTDPMASAIRG